jgi:hypothetical protein
VEDLSGRRDENHKAFTFLPAIYESLYQIVLGMLLIRFSVRAAVLDFQEVSSGSHDL